MEGSKAELNSMSVKAGSMVAVLKIFLSLNKLFHPIATNNPIIKTRL